MNVEERVMGPGTLRDLVERTCHHGEHGVDLAKPRTCCMTEVMASSALNKLRSNAATTSQLRGPKDAVLYP